MNLIEQQSAAKDLPMQYLQQAVNGQNPNLTPWIATAELQRRTTMNQHMAPKGPQGPQPTVKDQVEQKAGLMATQAAQQAQAAQAQQSSPPPGPIPGGIPQPEGQSEEPVMAARGGLMNAPVNFKFAHGGILGFAEAGSVPKARDTFTDSMGVERDAKTGEPVKPIYERMADWRDRQQAQAARPQRPVANAADERMLRAPVPAMAPNEAPQETARLARQPAPNPLAAAATQVKPPPAPVGGPRRAPTPPGPAVQQPAPTAQPAVMDPAEQAAQTYSTTPVKQMSAQDAIGEEQTMAKAYNLDQPMGVEERDIIAQRNAARDVARKREGGDAFSAYVSGLIGVPGAAGEQYRRALRDQATAEREHLSGNLKDIKDLNTAQRAAQEKRAGIAGSSLAAGKTASAEEGKSRAQVGATLTGDRMRAMTSKYNTDEQAKSAMEIAKMQERATTARLNSSEAKQAASELRDRERAIEADITALTSQRNKLSGSFTPADRAELTNVDELLRNARAQKALIRGDKGAAAPADVKITPTQAAALAKYGAK